MNKIKYLFGMNRVIACELRPRYFVLVSDEPLTIDQVMIIQEKLGYPEFPYQPVVFLPGQKKKMGKNTLQWSCYDV